MPAFVWVFVLFVVAIALVEILLFELRNRAAPNAMRMAQR